MDPGYRASGAADSFMRIDLKDAATRLPRDPTSGRTTIMQDMQLRDVGLDQWVELVRFDLPEDQAEALMERGLLPGCRLCPLRLAPSGDPIIEVDGVVLALRREIAACIRVMPCPVTGD